MRDNNIKEVLTAKSGKFSFSDKYSYEQLVELIIEARVLCNIINDLPILPRFKARINEELIRKSIFGTAAIEGNPLKEEEVGKILTQKSSTDGNEGRYKTEIRNLKKAYEWMDALPVTADNQILTEKMIKRIHKMITRDIEHENNVPGNYRNHEVKLGDGDHGAIYVPPKTLQDVKLLMNEFLSWINRDEFINSNNKNIVVIRAALTHYYICLIHPFGDGNGRTARLLEAMVLHLSGIGYVPRMLSNYYYRNIDNYFLAFSRTQKNKEDDVTEFLHFVLGGMVESSNEIKESITFLIRQFSLRDYYNFLEGTKVIAKRQYGLLLLLVDSSTDFTLWDLHNTSPFIAIYKGVGVRTVQRDLKKLLDKELLICSNNKEYSLNVRILD